jgi:peptidoglycan/xylan/chitin deacetylase (PgdA/CDA1 family)
MSHDSSAVARYPASRAWRPAPFASLSLAFHAAAGALLVVQPAAWPWVLAAIAGNHLLLALAVFLPRSQLLGPNLTRLPAAAAARGEVALTFDDGPDPEITPRILELLEQHGAKASFFCVGEKAVAQPQIVRDIARLGHSVENHSYRHSYAFACFGLGRLAREVGLAQDALARVTGRRPAFFRAPAGFRSPLLDFVLARRGLRYVSWTRRGYDSVDAAPARVLARLAGQLAPGDVLLLHDSSPFIVQILPTLLDVLKRRGLRSVSLPAAID